MEFQQDYKGFSEGLQRCRSAMGGTADQVPILSQLHEFALRQLGLSAREFYTTPHLLAAGTLEIMQRFGIDVPVLDYDVYNIEAEALGQAMVYSDEHMPDVDRSRPLIRDRSDLAKIRPLDFDRDGRLAAVIEANRIFRRLIGGAEVTIRFCAPFSLAANIRGLEQLVMDIYNDPDFAREMFDRITEEVLAPWIRRLQREFPAARAFSGDDAAGSLPIVSPQLSREWIVPYVLRLRELCGPQVYVPNWVGEHYLKDPVEMLDLKYQVCPDFVEGQDPDVERLGPEFYRQYANRRGVPLILGIGAAFLALSTPDAVADRVRRYLEAGTSGGGFALLLCNLGATTPPENVRAAVEAVRRHGAF